MTRNVAVPVQMDFTKPKLQQQQKNIKHKTYEYVNNHITGPNYLKFGYTTRLIANKSKIQISSYKFATSLDNLPIANSKWPIVANSQ